MIEFAGQMIRGIPVAKLRAILDDPANAIRDTDVLVVNLVGNLAFLVRDARDGALKSACMWINLAKETCEWPGKAEDPE